MSLLITFFEFYHYGKLERFSKKIAMKARSCRCVTLQINKYIFSARDCYSPFIIQHQNTFKHLLLEINSKSFDKSSPSNNNNNQNRYFDQMELNFCFAFVNYLRDSPFLFCFNIVLTYDYLIRVIKHVLSCVCFFVCLLKSQYFMLFFSELPVFRYKTMVRHCHHFRYK